MPTTAAEAIAMLGGSVLGGTMISICAVTLPVLFETTNDPAQLYQQWTRVYHYGSTLAPPFALTTLLLHGYTAYRKRTTGRPWALFAVAGALTISIVPFTAIFMKATNDELFRRAALGGQGALASGIDEARALVTKWGRLHFARSLLPLAGAVAGALASFGFA